jgi:low affinity Fe/Cu permease
MFEIIALSVTISTLLSLLMIWGLSYWDTKRMDMISKRLDFHHERLMKIEKGLLR